jgi:hypothetical protein
MVKHEVSGTVILPPLVFPVLSTAMLSVIMLDVVLPNVVSPTIPLFDPPECERRRVTEEEKIRKEFGSVTRGLCYKTFYGRN